VDDDKHHKQGDLENLIDEMLELGKDKDHVSLGDLKDAIGSRGFGPFLFIPSVIEISPVGGVPGIPTFIALIVGLFAIQALFGRKSLWLPGVITRRTLKAKRLDALEKTRKPIRWIDKVIRPRMVWATHEPFLQVVALITLVLCLSIPPLELIPFASIVPFGTIALFGLGIIGRDGMMVIAGMLLSGSALVAFLLR
jgi:hypothetical protein